MATNIDPYQAAPSGARLYDLGVQCLLSLLIRIQNYMVEIHVVTYASVTFARGVIQFIRLRFSV